MPDEAPNYSQQRRADNELIFKDANLQVARSQTMFDGETAIPTFFYCECGNRDCTERIQMTVDEYNDVHQHKFDFIIRAGHDMSDIEDVVSKNPEFWVVRKHENVRKAGI